MACARPKAREGRRPSSRGGAGRALRGQLGSESATLALLLGIVCIDELTLSAYAFLSPFRSSLAACRDPAGTLALRSRRLGLRAAPIYPSDAVAGQVRRWSHLAPRMAAQSSDVSTNKDSPEDKEHTEDSVIMVVDMDTSHFIEAFIDQRVYVGEGSERQEVLLCYPADIPVVLARFDEDVLTQVPDREVDRVFGTAAKLLRSKGLDLLRTAVCLTIQGSLEEDYSPLAPQRDELDEDESSRTVRVLATFDYTSDEGEPSVEYVITEPLDPVLMFAVASEEAEQLAAAQVLALTCGAETRPLVFCSLLTSHQISSLLPRVEEQLGRRFTQTYAGYGSSL